LLTSGCCELDALSGWRTSSGAPRLPTTRGTDDDRMAGAGTGVVGSGAGSPPALGERAGCCTGGGVESLKLARWRTFANEKYGSSTSVCGGTNAPSSRRPRRDRRSSESDRSESETDEPEPELDE
jgi:hypothetical protein